jgi:hypothetical protein
MTLQLLHPEFLIYEENLIFLSVYSSVIFSLFITPTYDQVYRHWCGPGVRGNHPGTTQVNIS